MGYRMLGWLHAHVARPPTRDQRGQGTVEYVALILLVAVVLAGVVAATRGQKFGATGIADAIVSKLKGAINGVK
jgi:Flp pilus assembly pilin Flp